MSKEKKNKSHGKVEKLPEDVKSEVNCKLIKGGTCKDVSQHLKEQGHDISGSAVWRYWQGYAESFRAIQMARDFAKALAEDNPERPSTEMNEAVNSIATQQLMSRLIKNDLDDKARLDYAKAAASLQNAQTNTERAKSESYKAAGMVKNARNSLKLKVFQELGEKNPELADAIMSIADEVAKQSDLKL